MHYPISADALDDRLAFVGTAGSGKTYNAGAGVELLLARRNRVIVIDPLGVWWGLRLRADGKAKSTFDIAIFGGKHGDLPLTEHAGALIGETVASMAESCIIDLSQIGTKAGERRFMLAFFTALYRGTNSPVHTIIDEADMFAPQRLLDKEGEAAKLLGMMETIVRRGRVKGFIPWLITQRPAVLSKDVLSQADGLIAFKLTSSQDRDAIGGWIEGQGDKQQGKDILASLPQMERGQGVVWIPSRGVLKTAKFPEKVTFDSSRTPKRGEKVSATSLQPLDLSKLKDRLAKVETEAKANDPRALRAEVARLKLAAASAPAATSVEQIEEAERVGHSAGYAAGFRSANDQWFAHFQKTKDAMPFFADAIGQLAKAHDTIEALLSPPILTDLPTANSIAPTDRKMIDTMKAPQGDNGVIKPHPTEKPARAASTSDGTFTGPQTRVLRSLAMWKAIGHEQPTREMVAACAGYSPSSGNFGNLLAGLSTLNAIGRPSPGAVSLAIAFDDMQQHEGVNMLLNNLGNPQRKIITALKGMPDMSREDLAARTDYSASSGNFGNLLASLSTLGIIIRPQAGYVALSDWAQQLLS